MTTKIILFASLCLFVINAGAAFAGRIETIPAKISSDKCPKQGCHGK